MYTTLLLHKNLGYSMMLIILISISHFPSVVVIIVGWIRKWIHGWAVAVHAFNPSTWEAEAGRFLSSRPAWSTKWVPGQPGLHREILSQKNQPNKQTQMSKLHNRCFTHSLILRLVKQVCVRSTRISSEQEKYTEILSSSFVWKNCEHKPWQLHTASPGLQ